MSVAHELGQEPIRKLTRTEYDQLVLAGCFEDERLELLYGMLVPMPPEGPPHSHSMAVLARVVFAHAPADVWVRVQNPIVAAGESEPEPDIAVVPGGDYSVDHPDHAHLVIELARSSLRRDRELKSRLYAESGFEEYWIVDLEGKRVEVYLQPEDGAYASKQTYRSGDVISPARFPDMRVALTDLF